MFLSKDLGSLISGLFLKLILNEFVGEDWMDIFKYIKLGVDFETRFKKKGYLVKGVVDLDILV